MTVRNEAGRELQAYAEWWIEQDPATMRMSLPTVLESLDDPDPAVRKQVSAFFALVSYLRRFEVSQVFGGMAGEIIDRFEDPEDQVRANLLRPLAMWNPAPPQEAVDLFVNALEDPSSEVRSAAVFGLVRAAPESDSAAQLIADTLDSLDPEARVGMVHTLRNVHADHPVIVQKIIEQLDQGHRKLTHTAAKALGALGSRAVEAIPRLRAIADNPETDDELRAAVESALRSIEQGSRRP